MCNAHNHHPKCNCGWGGGNNSSFGSYSKFYRTEKVNYSYKVLEIFPTSKFSLTIPNALCPECGARVFFYQNYYGSRVFFDSLGKPWPKHPCTDNNKFSTKDGKNGDVYSKDDFIIPHVCVEKNEVLQKGIKIHKFKSSSIFLNEYGKKMMLFNGIKFVLEQDFSNCPDIIIIAERKNKFYIETYEILTEVSQQILLIPKNYSDYKNLKHYGIDNNEILTISINFAVFNASNLYDVKIEHYDKNMQMKLSNFLERSQNNIKYLKYVNDENKNQFKVKYVNGQLYEME